MKLLSLFSGIGAPEAALKRMGIDYELVGFSEIDKYAARSYCAIHGVDESLNLGDITKIDETKLPKDIDLVTYGFPCVPAGSLVKTDAGYKAIEDIHAGDMVLTHSNRYRKVLKTMHRTSDHIISLKATGVSELSITDEHPVYVRRGGAFMWVKAKDLDPATDRIAYNIDQRSIPTGLSSNILWLLGRYCADGYKENHALNRPIFCIGKSKVPEFEARIGGFKFSKLHENRNCVEYKAMDDRVAQPLKCFKSGSSKKEIPEFILAAPINEAKEFLSGYLSGDGYIRAERDTTMFTTVSEKMGLGLSALITKVFSTVPSVCIRHDSRKETFNDSWNYQFHNISPNTAYQTVVGDKICGRIRNICRRETSVDVYNLEVEGDNSYTVSNVIVHNCQDISNAGKQKGLFNEDGSKTRSGLFFDALRIIQASQPKIAIAENVKALTGKKFKNEFELVLRSLEEAGYSNYWKVLNAVDFGIPQNRERVFIVSIRKDLDDGSFVFPEGFDLKLKLKDMLERQVPDKFYLSDVMIEGFERHKDRMAERGNGFGWAPTDGSNNATCVQTNPSRPSQNFIKEKR